MSFTVSSSLAISSKKPLDCEKVAEFLGKAGIITDVTSNISMQRGGKEYGCRLVQSISTKTEIENIWTALKDKYKLGCAHLTVANKYDGCILNYLAPSHCKAID
jgi:hypothetical protein